MMQLSQDLIIGISAGLLNASLYAASVVVYRSEGDEIRPIGAAALKMWIAFVLMSFIILLPFGYNPFSFSSEVTFLLILSIIANAVFGDCIYLISQERIGVAYAFPIVGLFPIFTYFIALFFLGEQLLISRLLGTVIAVLGVGFLSWEQNKNNINPVTKKIDKIGIGLAFLTAICYAIGTTILQVGMENIDPVEGNFVRVFFGSIAWIPIFLFTKQHRTTPSRRSLRNVLVAGFFGMGVSSLMYVTAVKYLGAAVSSVVNSTSQLFAVTFAIVFLKERVSRIAGLGVIAIVLGVILVVMGV